MALKAIPIGTKEFVSKHDTGDEKTVFVLKYLDSRIRANILDQFMKMNVSATGAGEDDVKEFMANLPVYTTARTVAQLAIVEIRNFLDENDNPIETKMCDVAIAGKKYRGLDHAVLDRIPSYVQKEIYDEVMADNDVDEDDEKNSD